VDRLLTGSPLSGDEYIYFQDQQLQYHRFIEGRRRDDIDPIHYTDEAGNPLYWNNESHEYMTPTETEFPVMVPVYDLTTKLEIFFDGEDGSAKIPKIVLGAGVGNPAYPDRGKGFIYKDEEGLLLKYLKSDGSESSIYLCEDGVVMPTNNLESIDFYNNGFKAAYDGKDTSYTWTKDEEGKITSLTTEDSAVIPITWNSNDM
jgi:hypothetical protein